MRVSHCKPYCPSVCFPKSSVSLRPPCAVKLEGVHNVAPSPTSVASVVEEKVSDGKADEVEKNEPEDAKPAVVLRSCLKKCSGSDDSGSGVEKRNVKWMDAVGKGLVVIKEFDSVESGDPEDNIVGTHFCVCVIQ